MRRQGDGTTRISARVRTRPQPGSRPTSKPSPTPAPTATSRDRRRRDRRRSGDPAAVPETPRARRSLQFLEAIDPTRLPIHGGDATTIIVTIPLASLRAELGAADLLGGGLVPGDDLTGDRITAAQARRLACTAKILPAVLDGTSLPIDLGRAKRLFSPTQRKALLIRDQTCRAEGCDTPGTWCDAHHLDPWHTAAPPISTTRSCSARHHHHRVHDTAYRTDRLPNGDLRFHRRK